MMSAESAPLTKAGCLSDAVGSLAKAMPESDCDARLIMPKYGPIDEKKWKMELLFKDIEIMTDSRLTSVNLWQTILPGSDVPVYLIEHPLFEAENFNGDGAKRFLFFSLGTLQILPVLEFIPDIIHCHDFHTAVMADLIKVSPYPVYRNVKTLLTIHELPYQEKGYPEIADMDSRTLRTMAKNADNDEIKLMAQGILNADRINSVSPSFAREILDNSEELGIENLIIKKSQRITGILNGLDMERFDPSSDPDIKKNYSYRDIENKSANKHFLQKKIGLPAKKKPPLIAMVSSLVKKKGIELLKEETIALMTRPPCSCQFVILGKGEKKFESELKRYNKKYSENFKFINKSDQRLAREIFAGSDILVKPSLCEPCGLGQMIAMRYGTVPVVRKTGGLADTVDPATGFVFTDFSQTALREALQKAVQVYYNKPDSWKRMQRKGMRTDFSWKKSAGEYLKLYGSMLKENSQNYIKNESKYYDFNLRKMTGD